MKKRDIFLSFILLVFCVSCTCSKVKDKTKEVINKSGETVGKSATEFIEGVSEGVDKTLQCQIEIHPDLYEKGLRTGKYKVFNDSLGNKNNCLTLYLIFEKDLKKTISLKVFDKSGFECGRTHAEIEGLSGNAAYYDFTFDKRTHIEAKSKITIE